MELRHCSLDSQAWTDLISNVTSLEPRLTNDDPSPWLGWGTAGPERLGVFLHEATHHWCFLSPVGFALAGMAMRSRQKMLRYLEQPDASATRALTADIGRVNATVAFLRPMAEGLALFAEFDS